jgi:hypothetical protein
MLREMAEKGETFYPRDGASETRSAA